MAWTYTFLIIWILVSLSLTLAGSINRKQKDKKNPKKVTSRILEPDDLPDDGSGDIFDDVGNGYEASGGATFSACYQKQMEAHDRKNVNAFVPQCTPAGEFDPKQCHSAIRMCWCVYSSGREVPNSRKSSLMPLHCSVSIDPDQPKSQVPSRGSIQTSRTQPTVKNDDVVIDETNKVKDTKNSPGGYVEFVETDNNDIDMDAKGNAQQRKSAPSSVLSKPGLLAAVIAVVVVGLVVVVIVVMFIVYRMRKKDEGSYALDEPKASPTIGYTKSHDREFFA